MRIDTIYCINVPNPSNAYEYINNVEEAACCLFNIMTQRLSISYEMSQPFYARLLVGNLKRRQKRGC